MLVNKAYLKSTISFLFNSCRSNRRVKCIAMKLNCSNDLAGSDLGKAIVRSSLPVRGYTKNKKETRNHKFRFFVIRCYESTRNQPVTDRNSMRSWFAIMSPTTDAFLHRGAKPLLLGIHFHCSARWYREYRVQFESSRQLLSHDHTPGSYLLLTAICITNKYNISISFYTLLQFTPRAMHEIRSTLVFTR